jgi:uncharacterized membrane protein YedE/YeeE
MVAHLYLITMLGGLLIGLAAGTVLLPKGRVAGVTGMVDSVVPPRSADTAWQVIFLLGLVAGGTLLSWLDPAALPVGQVAPIQLMVGAGLLVGFGARLSGRSTSGHGFCGIGRLTVRSGVATGCFSAAGLFRNERVWRS